MEDNGQMLFDDLPQPKEGVKEYPKAPVYETEDCKYCNDADVPCMYCRRGQERVPTLKELGRDKKPKKVA